MLLILSAICLLEKVHFHNSLSALVKWHLKANLSFSVKCQALIIKDIMPLGGQMHIVASTISKTQPTFALWITGLLNTYRHRTFASSVLRLSPVWKKCYKYADFNSIWKFSLNQRVIWCKQQYLACFWSLINYIVKLMWVKLHLDQIINSMSTMHGNPLKVDKSLGKSLEFQSLLTRPPFDNNFLSS